jgi:NAD(P)-dependent dehydrogenase (short-subunit alcohol dehydrogenase family)
VSRKHTIVVGGTKGVGRELALLLAAEGQVVTAVGRNPAAFPAFDSCGAVVGFPGDLEAPDALLAALKARTAEAGRLSSLVFLQRYRGAGDAWAGELAVSLTATKVLIEGLAGEFAADGDRSICVVGSNASEFVARSQPVAYHAAKAALRQMARYYAATLGAAGIRVNVVSPCAFVKPESAAYYAGRADLQGLYARITPLGRMGTAREVAEVVAFLCGPKASFVTGQDLAVDGGMSLTMHDSLAREAAGLPG